MNIVLMESLGIESECLNKYIKKLTDCGHNFKIYDRTDNKETQKEELKDADLSLIHI